MGLYKRHGYLNKLGEPPVRKDEYVDRIAVLLGKDPEIMESLAKANKTILRWIEEALIERKCLIESKSTAKLYSIK
jgi:hypothetical protein